MLASFVAVLLFAATSSCQRFLFSFGNSYTTTSFNIASTKPSSANPIGNPAYPGYTTCGGPNWVDVFTTQVPGTLAYNFAVGGAVVNNSNTFPSGGSPIPDFIAQRGLFSANLVPPPSYAQWNSSNSIVGVFMGINDVGNSYSDATTSPSKNQQSLATYMTELDALYTAGLRRFVLFTVPPLARTPLFMTPPNNGVPSILVTEDIASFNAQLKATAASFQSSHAGSQVRILATNPIFRRILNHPTQYGAPNNSCFNSDGTSCLWWDAYHPGQAIQKAMGLKMYSIAQKLGFF